MPDFTLTMAALGFGFAAYMLLSLLRHQRRSRAWRREAEETGQRWRTPPEQRVMSMVFGLLALLGLYAGISALGSALGMGSG